jgi:hypothetical protein
MEITEVSRVLVRLLIVFHDNAMKIGFVPACVDYILAESAEVDRECITIILNVSALSARIYYAAC